MPVETATGVVPKLAAISGMAGEMMVASRISMNRADAAISAISVGLPEGCGTGPGAEGCGAGAGPSRLAPDLAGRVTLKLRSIVLFGAPALRFEMTLFPVSAAAGQAAGS